MELTLHNEIASPSSYPVVFTDNLCFTEQFKKLVRSPLKKVICFDAGFIQHWPHLKTELTDQLGTDTVVLSFLGGESGKEGFEALDGVLQALDRARLPRGSLVLAFGGGAFLDVMGLACALLHRGLDIVRFPTTVLAQNDAGIGVKNGINWARQKNCLGTFKVPHAVINDSRFLESLPERDLRSGMAEAIKVALLKDVEFFLWLERNAESLAKFSKDELNQLIKRCAELHLEQITKGGDPFEQKGLRPLDFGHWLAHRLEVLSQHEIRHGEAVAVGLLVDSLYSANIGALEFKDCDRIKSLLTRLGFKMSTPFAVDDLIVGLEQFADHLGGEFQLSVLTAIGESRADSEIKIELFKSILHDFGAHA